MMRAADGDTPSLPKRRFRRGGITCSERIIYSNSAAMAARELRSLLVSVTWP
jgi:hypothetical protein